jgi:hypothetical protein
MSTLSVSKEDSHWRKPGRRWRAMIYESGNLPPAGTGIPHGVPDHEGLIVPLSLMGFCACGHLKDDRFFCLAYSCALKPLM